MSADLRLRQLSTKIRAARGESSFAEFFFYNNNHAGRPTGVYNVIWTCKAALLLFVEIDTSLENGRYKPVRSWAMELPQYACKYEFQRSL